MNNRLELSFPHDRLDPNDWEAFRAIGHQVFDDVVEYLKSLREQPTWQSPSEAARQFHQAPLPIDGQEFMSVYEQFKEHILPYPTGNIHPRFWGWVMGSGTPVGIIADLLLSTMNCHVSGYDQSATLVERQVIVWLAEMMEMPSGTSGVLVSGGTAANLLGITVARNTLPGSDVRSEGLVGIGQNLVAYGSTATHGWAGRSCDLLGLGEQGFRKIATDKQDRVDVEEMKHQIDYDRKVGLTPFCIVANARTVATGSTDDLHALADLARAEGLWFHVDGAFGALVKLSPKYQHLVNGMERADSLAFDLHKWGYMQYETGAILIRDAEAHKAAFSFAPSHLEAFEGGIAVQPTEFASLGVQLSRGFRALRVWMNLSTYGVRRIGEVIERNIEDVQYLKNNIEAQSELELLGPANMNVVCFRYRPDRVMTDRLLDELNKKLLVALQQSGLAVPSSARIDGKFAIRVAHTNHRSVRRDFDLLLESVLNIGRGISESLT